MRIHAKAAETLARSNALHHHVAVVPVGVRQDEHGDAVSGDLQLLPARASTTIRTPARVRLHAVPSSVPAGGTVRFTGRLLGGHLPPGGKLVELQARVGADWRTFATVRPDRPGRYGDAQRIAASSGGRSFWFRARVRRERAYPFERASTPPLPVRVT